MANKCPMYPERGTKIFEWFCKDKTDRIKKTLKYRICKDCENYKKEKTNDDEMEMSCETGGA